MALYCLLPILITLVAISNFHYVFRCLNLCPSNVTTDVNLKQAMLQARVQEFVRGGGGAQNLKAVFFFFFFFSISRGGGSQAPCPPPWTRACVIRDLSNIRHWKLNVLKLTYKEEGMCVRGVGHV